MTPKEGSLALVTPSTSLASSFLGMLIEFEQCGELSRLHALANLSLERYLEVLEELQNPQSRVPTSTFWICAGKRVVGELYIRHSLTSTLEQEGGHIGYIVRPSWRRRGVGTAALGLGLREAARLGMVQAILTCDSDNLASIGVIRKNGGRFVGSSESPYSGKEVDRYKVTLSSGSFDEMGNATTEVAAS